ncbi:hypothetical protein JW859_01865 [bacterium]|nr:hypothetical protein [bacterium]
MSGQPGAFYSRLYFWVYLFPPYVVAALYYLVAWLINPASPSLLGNKGLAFMLLLVLVLVDVNWLSWLGFWLTGITRRKIAPVDGDRLAYEQAVALFNERAQQSATALTGPLEPLPLELIELGAVPYLALGGLGQPRLWLSTHTLRTTDSADLARLLAHEYGHRMEQQRGAGCNFAQLQWWLALPVGWLLCAVSPLLLIAAALVHALIALRVGYHQRLKAESRADRWAADRVGALDYARALAAYHRAVAGARQPGALKQRLVKLGLDPADVAGLLNPPAGAQAGN